MTKIQWTQKTWNPIVGCTIATPGCTNCYAMKTAWRMGHNPSTPQYHGLTKKVNGNAVWTGKMNLVEKVLLQPLKRKKPTMYFVNSMGDLFHESVPDEWIDRVFAVMALCPQHTFQVLTKRADRMLEYFNNGETVNNVGWAAWIEDPETVGKEDSDFGLYGSEDDLTDVHPLDWPLPNVWLGVSVEDQTRADERIPALLDTPAAVRFVSAEPLLGAIKLTRMHIPDDGDGYLNALNGEKWIPGCGSINSQTFKTTRLDWAIVGGESGPKARPMHPDWARSLRDQCVAAGVPFFFKQWGEWVGGGTMPNGWSGFHNGSMGPGCDHSWGDGAVADRTGTKAAGNLLDGELWQQMPEVE